MSDVNQNKSHDNGVPNLHLTQDLHLLRKLWHAVMGILLFWLIFYSGLSKMQAVVILAILLTLDLILEITRLSVQSFNRFFLKVCGSIMRADEKVSLSGTPYYLAGTLISLLIFPTPVAMLAILFLVLGDPAASTVGILTDHKGPKLPGRKTVLGTGTAGVLCFIISLTMLWFCPWSSHFHPSTLLLLSLYGGFVGAVAECLPLPVNDNLTIPVVSGLLLWPVFSIMS